MKRLLVLLLPITFVMAPSASVTAETRYGAWSNPAGGTSADSKMVDELNKLIDDAEKARAADPVFLRDLRALLGRHSNPWSRESLRDDFRDGDYARNPAWTVASGKYWIEKDYGLRSAVTPGQATAAQPTTKKISKEEVAAAVIGSLLGRAMGNKGQTTTTTTQPAPAKMVPAKIYSAVTISNAFSMTAEITSWKKEGAFAIGPYQGARSSGYRLVYHPGQNRSLELVRYSTRGTSVIDAYDKPLDLEDNRAHVIEWTRTKTGDMAIKIDGKGVLQTSDRSFRDSFAGVMLENHGGDYVLARINVFGE